MPSTSSRRALAAAVVAALAFLSVTRARAQVPAPDWERFDVAGLPERPTTFLEQQLAELLAAHRPGDAPDAAALQRKLARWHREHGDTERALAAERRADAAATSATSLDVAPVRSAPSPALARGADRARSEGRAGGAAAAGLGGRYYGMSGRTLHTWDFSPDGTFVHTVVATGAGTSVRTGERGRFELDGGTLVVHVQRTATGFVTPGSGRSTQVGGGLDAAGEVRRLRLKKLGAGASARLVLDGLELKPRSW